MNTPICDFVRKYADGDALRLHMPGHKGKKLLGYEEYDITEIDGADSLYEADGIIAESEKNASLLFGADTFYSTEGSSLCIRAMLYLALLDAKSKNRCLTVLAGRNAHKTFLTSSALLGFDIEWLYGTEEESYLSCTVNPEMLEDRLKSTDKMPMAIYLTSPDYPGNIADIRNISAVCHKYGVLMIVDNAHGAYLKFLPESQHPIDLGADLCCDSAHKTLPVLTGGAYLHISENAPDYFKGRAKSAMSLFGSTSPSYLILQSLDAANQYISDGYSQKLAEFLPKIEGLKNRLSELGYTLCGNEPMKITISTKGYGYRGTEFAKELEKRNIVCEFCDSDFTVLMLTPEIGEAGLKVLETALEQIPKKMAIDEKPPQLVKAEKVMSVRDAVFAGSEELDADKCDGRVFAGLNISCPPAVPIVVCGEQINSKVIECLKYYGTEKCIVVK